MTCFKRNIFLISSTSKTVYGIWRQTLVLSLLNWFWIFIFAYITALSGAVFSTSYPTCFPFQECLGLLCIKDSPSYLTVFFPYLQNIIKGFAGEIEGTVPGGVPAVGDSALQYFRLARWEDELQSWSLLLCQPGFLGVESQCWLPQQEPCWEYPTASQTWATAGLWTLFIYTR